MHQTARGRIGTGHSSFILQGDDNDFSADLWTVGFITARQGVLWFLCGSQNRYVGVDVEVADEALDPRDVGEWEHVVECTYTFAMPPYFRLPMSSQGFFTDPALVDLSLDAGPTRVRAYTRGRRAGSEQSYTVGAPTADEQSTDPDELVEQFRIELWPATDIAEDNEPRVLTGG